MLIKGRAAVHTFGELGKLSAKMAHGILRFCDNIAVIVDPAQAGKRLRDVLPYAGKDLPIVADIREALGYGIEELVVGTSPPGGGFDAAFVGQLIPALKRGCRVISGLHDRVSMLDEVFPYRHLVLELRAYRERLRVAHGDCAKLGLPVVLTVGSDCASGKMTTALEIDARIRARGKSSAFIATGQTGIYISGRGIPLDALPGDFMAGAVEKEVLDAAQAHQYVLVEGQGSLFHPAYSGVSLALMHGAAPNLLIFCHDMSRKNLAYFESEVVSLADQITALEGLCRFQRRAQVIGMALFGDRDRERTLGLASGLEAQLGLPVVCPALDGVGRLADLVMEFDGNLP